MSNIKTMIHLIALLMISSDLNGNYIFKPVEREAKCYA